MDLPKQDLCRLQSRIQQLQFANNSISCTHILCGCGIVCAEDVAKVDAMILHSCG